MGQWFDLLSRYTDIEHPMSYTVSDHIFLLGGPLSERDECLLEFEYNMNVMNYYPDMHAIHSGC